MIVLGPVAPVFKHAETKVLDARMRNPIWVCEKTHHLNILIHIFVNVFDVDARRIFLHALVEHFIGTLDLRKKCLNSRKN